jgi:hypothetical protein
MRFADVLAMPMDTPQGIQNRWDAAREVWGLLNLDPETADFAVPQWIRLLILIAHRNYTLDELQREFGSDARRSQRGRPSHPLYDYLEPAWFAKLWEQLQDMIYGFDHVLPVEAPSPPISSMHRPRLAPSKWHEHRQILQDLRLRARSFKKVLRSLAPPAV